jgi:hypothetical protein
MPLTPGGRASMPALIVSKHCSSGTGGAVNLRLPLDSVVWRVGGIRTSSSSSHAKGKSKMNSASGTNIDELTATAPMVVSEILVVAVLLTGILKAMLRVAVELAARALARPTFIPSQGESLSACYAQSPSGMRRWRHECRCSEGLL